MLKTISSITNALGALNYKGTWDANANSPALASSVGTKGDYYVVGTAGSTTLNGISNWGVGDWAAFNGSVWQRVEGGTETDTNVVVFNTLANVTPTVGELTWANDDRFKTLALGMANGDIQYIGEEQYFRVKASSAITKGQVVMFSGTLGASGGLQGAPATGLQPEQANYILGIAKDTLSTNSWGYVQFFGEVKGINTTGGAENWVQGDVLYYNPLVTGGLTKIKPTAPATIAIVAAVVYVSLNNGILFVRPTYGSVLGGTDGNVNFVNLATNDYITYNGSGVWTNKQPANVVAGVNLSGGGLVIANTAITINLDDSISLSNVTANNVVIETSFTANLNTANVAAMPDPSMMLAPEGYIEVNINGATKKIPYYGV
jgi:hypothetical protein